MASLVLLGASILAIVIAVVAAAGRTRWTASQMSPEDVERVRQRLCDWGFRQGQEQGPALAAHPIRRRRCAMMVVCARWCSRHRAGR